MMYQDVLGQFYHTNAIPLAASSIPYHGYFSLAGVGLVFGILCGGVFILAMRPMPVFMLAFRHETDIAMAVSFSAAIP
jgi:hypothetical protein